MSRCSPFIFGVGCYGSGGGGGGGATLTISVYSEYIKGRVATEGDLPSVGNTTGDGYITSDTGNLWVWDGAVWVDNGIPVPITSASFDQEVYIDLDVIGITTPTEYRFMIFDTSDNGIVYIEAGTPLAYTVASFGNLLIYAEATDGVVIAAALEAFELTVSSDVDADAFIAAHNALSGLSMDVVQQAVVQNSYIILKGFGGSPNGSDLWTYFRGNSYSRMWPLVPISDSSVSIPAFGLDMIWLDTAATFNGMLLGDFAVTGVTGGSGKYFNAAVSPSNFAQNSISVSSYSRSNVDLDGAMFGAGDTFNTKALNVRAKLGGIAYFYVNSAVQSPIANTNSQGAYISTRTASTSQELYKNGSLLSSGAGTSAAPTANSMYFHGINIGSLNRVTTAELSFYHISQGLTLAQQQDLNYLINYIQVNVITGGRNV